MMGNSPELSNIDRTLRDIRQELKNQNRILEKIHASLSAPKTDTPPSAPTEVDAVSPFPINTPKIYGWSMAASVQREGNLKAGDMKREADESYWIWTAESCWERVEPPSVRPLE